MKTKLSYGTLVQDRQLASITHLQPGLNAVADSAFDTQWDVVGRLQEWGQASVVPGGATLQGHHGSYSYDGADQLTQAVRTEGGVETNRRTWAYDVMGNRTSEARGSGGARQWVANEFNQLTSGEGRQAVEVRGTLDRPAEVKINGKSAAMNGLEFSATLALSAGEHEVALEARQPADADGPAQTVRGKVRLTVAGGVEAQPYPYTYDANGNLLDDGARTYEWDAENRLVATNGAWGRSEFAYDGLSRRVKLTDNGVERRLVWDGMAIAEERDASGALVKRFWGVGEERFDPLHAPPSTLNLYYLRDHLGSLRAVADANGAIRARYSYSEWGERSQMEGNLACDFGFTGHFEHGPSGLTLAPYRGYDSSVGRWLSRDPIGEEGGLNLYGYVNNSPVSLSDLFGLEPGRPYNTEEAAGKCALKDADDASFKNSGSWGGNSREFGGNIYKMKDGKSFSYTPLQTGDIGSNKIDIVDDTGKYGGKKTADYHSHPYGTNPSPSDYDRKRSTEKDGFPKYGVGADGKMWRTNRDGSVTWFQ